MMDLSRQLERQELAHQTVDWLHSETFMLAAHAGYPADRYNEQAYLLQPSLVVTMKEALQDAASALMSS